MASFVKTIVKDRPALVTFERPPVNALNTAALHELSETFDAIGGRADVRVIIFTGAGDRAFVAGADIAEMAAKTGIEMKAFSELGRRLGDVLAKIPQPVLAAINGVAFGGGCELALACDLRIASDRARLGQPEVNLGILPGFGGSQRLPRLVGRGWASELILTGEAIDAATAERIGLVNHVVPHDRLLVEAEAIARKILSKGPIAVRLAKAAIRQSEEGPLSAGLSFETAAFGIAGSTKDKAEGMRAFLEKRPPKFTGE